jgi:TolB-like protein/class 3 adenylate cyclase/Tfp pilus assembly protein PilF
MAEERVQRRLAAILAADVVGYSRLMEQNEAGTLAVLKERRKAILRPLVAEYLGRIVKVMGDGVLVEFASAVNAVACAVELQKRMAAANDGTPDDRQIALRIGINLGDVVVEGSDLYGEGIIIAVRLQAMAGSGEICVSGAVHEQIGNKLPLAFEDLGPCEIKNISKPIRVLRSTLSDQDSRHRSVYEPRHAKPSIAVLPFANLSGDPEQESFVDGLTEDIITALSRSSGFWVIARTSTFTYKGRSVDAKHVAKELGARYVIEGSVRCAGDRIRVTAQLIDAESGHHAWAERYDRPLADIFDIQDDITRSVAASTETQVLLAERVAAESRPSTNYKAKDLIARGWARSYDQTIEALAEASDLVEEGIRLDPSNPLGHRVRAAIYLGRMNLGEISHDAECIAQALDLGRTALQLAPGDEMAHYVMAWAYGEAGRLEDAIAVCERGLEINPNCSLLFSEMGACLAPLGRPKEAIEACRLALRLNPRDPSNFWRHSSIATAHFVAADYDAAMEESEKIARSRSHIQSGIIWAASAAALGKAEQARMAIEYCLAQRPDLHVSRVVPDIMLRFVHKADHDRLLAFLRKAGLPG